MNFPDLNSATVSDKELNSLAYDPGAFPAIRDMVSSPQFASPLYKPIDLTRLSKNGVIKLDPMAEYLANKSESSSGLKEVLKTPFHYLFYKQQKPAEPEKAHFALGTFAHMAFIEPERFDKFIVEPAASMAKKDGILELIRFYEKTNGVFPSGVSHLGEDPKMNDLKNYLSTLKEQCQYSVVAEEFKDIIQVLKQSYHMYGNGIIARILKGAIGEASFYGTDEETGLPVKVRPDFFNVAENIGVNAVISFKTTSASTLNKFIYDTAKFQYELSEGMYQEVVSRVTGRQFNVTIMIMLQTVPPYLPAVFWWGPEDLTNGKNKYRMAIHQVKQCQKQMLYPGFDAMGESGNYGIIDLNQPEWAKKELHPVDIED